VNDAATNAVTAPATDIEFLSAYDQGFARVAAVTLPVVPVDPAANASAIIEQARTLAEDGVCLAAFPELCLTGYAIDDLLLSDVLLSDVLAAIETLRAASAGLLPALVVGAPLRLGDRLYNCALVIQGGRVRGVAPKSYLPTYREFYEKRHFAPGDALPAGVESIELPGVRSGSGSADGVEPSARVPFGANLLFEVEDVPGLTFHVEVCEDMWVPVPPSSVAALAGATVLVNLSGSPITVGRAEGRELPARSPSPSTRSCPSCSAIGSCGPNSGRATRSGTGGAGTSPPSRRPRSANWSSTPSSTPATPTAAPPSRWSSTTGPSSSRVPAGSCPA